ncbi:hypothetical protein JOQ06_007326 [Pogonophryne albipinna]|uniref:Uncharacterized protein n=1 Tax=Pogonophryne albipinna TaxID=1090488 RepID=A0AAD6B1G0_9TELE|nr:hypothetical protein JOQ06_007326 [Pogonophryne albipinna]
MCPCGVVYSVKFNLRAESLRDFTTCFCHGNIFQMLQCMTTQGGWPVMPTADNHWILPSIHMRGGYFIPHQRTSNWLQRGSLGPYNSCLKVIEKLANDQGIKVFSANSYVAHTWFIPSVQNPEQHLLDKADDFQWILAPRALDNMSLGQPVRHYSTVGGSAVLQCSKTSCSACVTWTLERILCKRHSILQLVFNVFFTLEQYALYFVMESAFDFSELDMEHLRRWWCMLLIDNFPVTFEGRRSTKRRLEREDCEDSPRKKDPLAKTAAEILVLSEEEDGEKHPFISSAMAASQWCSAKKMGDKVILPQILSMAPLDREAALHNLGEASNLRDEDSWEDRMDPFMFRFKFESDYLMFFEQCIDKENLKVHACFEERG